MHGNYEIKNNTGISQAVPFFSVRDIERSIRFYIDGLGFEMKSKWIKDDKLRWCWLQNGGAALMLQENNSLATEQKLGDGMCIYFICDNALSIYHESKSKGIHPSTPFVGNNMWVVGLKDPDGYNIFFESATDVPEGTEYAD